MDLQNDSSRSVGTTQLKLNLSEVIEDMFMVLTNKEKNVIVKRFSLDNKAKQTLEKIGKSFNVTRERVRQIEKIALNKLRRTISNTKLAAINKLAKQILEKRGGVMTESSLISDVLKAIYVSSEVDACIINLSLSIDADVLKNGKTNTTYSFWRLQSVSEENLKKIIDKAIVLLEEAGDVVTAEVLIKGVKDGLEKDNLEVSEALIQSVLETDRRIKKLDEGYGLMTWRHINPRSIRDKAYVILKKAGQPMHFVAVANEISEVGFDRKVVTTQAVHNELIRHPQFVLVGRGLYALKEWGYKSGAVVDVIESLLKKKSPMTKKEIVKGVLKQRQVKKGTISLNLQKNPQFVRVGRAVYKLDLAKK